jgi:hypothetical protein
MLFYFDIVCNDSFINNFAKKYIAMFPNEFNELFAIENNNKSDNKSIYIHEKISREQLEEMIKIIVNKCLHNYYRIRKERVTSTMYDVCEGDYVSVKYFPDSQKYSEYYDNHNFNGTIIHIDNDNDNMILFYEDYDCKSKDHVIYIKTLEREGCHYLGMSRGYDILIEKK